MTSRALTSLEICAGAGGQALGLEQAGFDHLAVVEIDSHACATLRLNRPDWNVVEGDVKEFHAFPYRNVDLLAGGVPCPPFSKAGKQLGQEDERDLFPQVLRLVEECSPKAVMVENVAGLLDAKFAEYRTSIETELIKLGYRVAGWNLMQASDYGVSQLRPRVIMVALKPEYFDAFTWPVPDNLTPVTVGELLYNEMVSKGWQGAEEWSQLANKIAPTLVGGSKKHGGPDLGPTRSKRAWETLGVNGHTIADEAPAPDHIGMPRLTVKMAALVQGFPPEWEFFGRKTAAYRQVGNAFPPPVARAVGEKIYHAISTIDAAFDDDSKLIQGEMAI